MTAIESFAQGSEVRPSNTQTTGGQTPTAGTQNQNIPTNLLYSNLSSMFGVDPALITLMNEACADAQKTVDCMRLKDRVYGSDPFEGECRDRYRLFDEESAKLGRSCRDRPSQCNSTLDLCSQALEQISGISGTTDQVVQAYGMRYQSLSPQCKSVLVARDADFLKDQRREAQDRITDIEKEVKDLNKESLENQAKFTEDMQELRQNTLDQVEKYLEEAAVNEEGMKRLLMKLKGDFQKAANEVARKMTAMNSQLREVESILPNKINMEYQVKVSKVASDCLEKGRAEAEKRRLEREQKKANYRYVVTSLNSLANTTNGEGDARSRFIKDRKFAERLCLQDQKPTLDALKKQQEMEIKMAHDKAVAIKEEIKMLEIEMQNLVDMAQNDQELTVAEKMRQKEKFLAKADIAQSTFYQRSSELQMQQMQQAQNLQKELQRLDVEKRRANLTLVSLPTASGQSNKDYENFQDALSASYTLATYRGDMSTCCDGKKPKFGGRTNMCTRGSEYRRSGISFGNR